MATPTWQASWIPCTERLPIACFFSNCVSESDQVLVTCHGHVTIAELERYEGGRPPHCLARRWRPRAGVSDPLDAAP